MKKVWSVSLDESLVKMIKKYDFLPWSTIVNDSLTEFFKENESDLNEIKRGISNLKGFHISRQTRTSE